MALDNKITIYIPSTIDGNKPARRAQRKETKRAATFFCTYFGGATATRAEGYYTSPEKGLIKESQNLIYSACTTADLEKHTAKVMAYAKRLCRRMKQECITVEVNNAMYLVEA